MFWLLVSASCRCNLSIVTTGSSLNKLRALGKPRPNAVKFFSSIELIALLADPNWLDDATKTIGQHWRRKNARRNGLSITEQADVCVGVGQKACIKG